MLPLLLLCHNENSRPQHMMKTAQRTRDVLAGIASNGQ
jgi:hypothetical protein